MNRFSVGEEVIIQAKNNTQYNGSIVVVADCVFRRKGTTRDLVTQKINDFDGYSYMITPNLNEMRWREASLRKIHKPSTQSFSEIMKELKNLKIAQEVL